MILISMRLFVVIVIYMILPALSTPYQSTKLLSSVGPPEHDIYHDSFGSLVIAIGSTLYDSGILDDTPKNFCDKLVLLLSMNSNTETDESFLMRLLTDKLKLVLVKIYDNGVTDFYKSNIIINNNINNNNNNNTNNDDSLFLLLHKSFFGGYAQCGLRLSDGSYQSIFLYSELPHNIQVQHESYIASHATVHQKIVNTDSSNLDINPDVTQNAGYNPNTLAYILNGYRAL